MLKGNFSGGNSGGGVCGLTALLSSCYTAYRSVKDDIGVVDFPQHLLNTRLGMTSSVYHRDINQSINRVRDVGGNCAKHLTVESYTIIMLLTVICLERGADLHMAQLMPLPLTVSCFRCISHSFFHYRLKTFLF